MQLSMFNNLSTWMINTRQISTWAIYRDRYPKRAFEYTYIYILPRMARVGAAAVFFFFETFNMLKRFSYTFLKPSGSKIPLKSPKTWGDDRRPSANAKDLTYIHTCNVQTTKPPQMSPYDSLGHIFIHV